MRPDVILVTTSLVYSLCLAGAITRDEAIDFGSNILDESHVGTPRLATFAREWLECPFLGMGPAGRLAADRKGLRFEDRRQDSAVCHYIMDTPIVEIKGEQLCESCCSRNFYRKYLFTPDQSCACLSLLEPQQQWDYLNDRLPLE